MDQTKATLILAGAIVVAGLLAGGVYEASSGGNSNVFVVNKYTGTVSYCVYSGCR